ncbi:MAG: LysM peptidoglycan-binding domain-containing protein [Lacrimispora sphenoides]
MIIHVVQPGETLNSISEYYKIPVNRLILENGITNPYNLAIGQTIVIVQPETLYTVQPGDTLDSIAKQHSVTPMEILRNNPYLSDRETLFVGESLVISYQTNKTKTIATNGYIFPYIDKSVLIKTLPFLSYLTIFNYRATGEGEIISTFDDTELIQLAKTYDAAPMMFVSTITRDGIINSDEVFKIISNPSVLDRLVDKSLQIMKAKGFYGINIYAELITFGNINTYKELLKKVTAIYHSEGFRVFITLTPTTNINTSNISFDKIDYSLLSEFVDGIILSSYEWARSYNFPNAIFPATFLRETLDYMVSIIPSEKIFLGIITLGYDWTLPYIPGASEATAISYNSAVQIAADNHIPIQFNEAAQSPYFFYIDIDGSLHVVWIKDARSYEERSELVEEYNLQGLSFWTVMKFDTQMWYVINSQYYIQKF